MRVPFALALAWRESRSSVRRLGIYMGSITLGVAALVAINSFRENVAASIRAEARTLLGADALVEHGRPFPPEVRTVLDSMAAAGVPVSELVGVPSMALVPASGHTRLVQLRAADGRYPFYGVVETDPPGLWPLRPGARDALVDPALLVQLDARVGDTISIGAASFRIAGTVQGLPGELGFQTAIGPRVFVPLDALDETGLVRTGSLVRYQAFLHLPGAGEVERFEEAHRERFRALGMRVTSADGQARRMTRSMNWLGRFLGLVGLSALLLGGVGVASAVHVFVKEKLTTVAVLRCIGARQWTVFTAYLLQAGLLGLAGSAVGAALGLGVQAWLPRLFAGLLPVEVGFRIRWPTVFAGLGVGVWVAVVFALIPLLSLRDVPPLAALRQRIEPIRRRRDRARGTAYGALLASILVLALTQAPEPEVGFAFAGAIAATALLLWLTAAALVEATRRFFPARASYGVRQGVANLFRPQNQTVAITLALGFGIFLIATLYLVQVNLLDRFRVESAEDRPNLVLFDVQPDQRAGVAELLVARGAPAFDVTPIVPARIAALNGRPAAEILVDPEARVEGWALRREYRNTYRDTLVHTEALVAGEWWGGAGNPRAGRLPRISLETDVAEALGVGIGDRITWDFHGIPIETEVANLRTVDWARFEPNFFVVFEPGVIEAAPHTLVALVRLPDAESRAETTRALVEAFPNVSVLDLALVQETLDDVTGKAALAVRFLALFSVLGGVVVLVGALATSRFQRVREAALLKTLGASRRQVRQILLTEYAALGALAGLVGVLLAGVASWALVSRFFEFAYRLPVAPILAFWLAAVALTTVVGLLNSRDVLRRPPLAVLRELAE